MPTLTLQKSNSRVTKVEINLDQWEKLADIFGFYSSRFVSTLKKSLKESRSGKVRKVGSLRELE
ncbi:MAG: hypothetical protein HY505_01735 [Candidatus Yanofskybacteria bacterium]|nr:hypothetical protein [Candidatus Yanofskybacteria bacterium]